ncbi:hypothetical protein [Bradyrhizobium sp.]|uniref:hypothetical protein n=1 Tax=Bradyrhizobium sp. TaxID=376 RepID=UPI0039E40AEE
MRDNFPSQMIAIPKAAIDVFQKRLYARQVGFGETVVTEYPAVFADAGDIASRLDDRLHEGWNFLTFHVSHVLPR